MFGDNSAFLDDFGRFSANGLDNEQVFIQFYI